MTQKILKRKRLVMTRPLLSRSEEVTKAKRRRKMKEIGKRKR